MSQQKHQPERTCVGCRRKFPQYELLAIRKLRNGTVLLDKEQQFHGRSVYLCRNRECFSRALKGKKKNAFAYGLKSAVPEEVLEELRKILGIS